MEVFGQESDVFFGEISDKDPPDWREELENEEDPDDEELDETSADVIAMLGFDPKEM